MKKALALCAFALAMTLPLVSSASSITANFVGSTSGTTNILVGDTLTFDVVVTLDAGTTYAAVGFTVSGDTASTAVDNPLTHDLTAQQVTAAILGPVVFGTSVDWSGGFYGAVAPTTAAIDVSNRFVRYTALTNSTTTATGPALIGTVTIQATSAGGFTAGGIIVTGIDGLGADTGIVQNGLAYTVVPEPGTAMLMLLGLGGLGVMGRKNR